jgi:hypothetical protein
MNERWATRWEKIQDLVRQLESLDQTPDQTEATGNLMNALRASSKQYLHALAVALTTQKMVPKTLQEFHRVIRDE